MTASRLLPGLLALLLPLYAGASGAEWPADYAAAKQRADQDEAALPAALASRVHQAQARALDEGVARCATPQPDTSAFTIVVALDAEGAVLRSWRAGDTPLAICMEKFLRDQRLPAPDTAPLLLAYELSFTP